MEIKEILNEQRIYAVLNHVPILRESEVHLFEELIDLYKPQRVLEIGTAIGYSTLLIAKHLGKNGKVVSLELDVTRHLKAKEFIKQSDFEHQIELYQGDANELVKSVTGSFDMVFLDGPKGQYLRQLELLLPKLKGQAVILADNVLFRGYVRGDKDVPRRFKTITHRLREYLTYVENKELFNTTIYPLGDGMSISIWKGFSNK